MRCSLPTLALIVAGLVAVAPAPAQFGGGGFVFPPGDFEAGSILVETVGGNHVTGTPGDQSLTIVTEDLGTLTVPLGRVELLELPGEGQPARLVTAGRSQLRGRVEFDALALETEFGSLSIDREKIRRIVSAEGVKTHGISAGPMPGMMGGMPGMGGGMMMGGPPSRMMMRGGPPRSRTRTTIEPRSLEEAKEAVDELSDKLDREAREAEIKAGADDEPESGAMDDDDGNDEPEARAMTTATTTTRAMTTTMTMMAASLMTTAARFPSPHDPPAAVSLPY